MILSFFFLFLIEFPPYEPSQGFYFYFLPAKVNHHLQTAVRTNGGAAAPRMKSLLLAARRVGLIPIQGFEKHLSPLNCSYKELGNT